jgi:hypothetical protein
MCRSWHCGQRLWSLLVRKSIGFGTYFVHQQTEFKALDKVTVQYYDITETGKQVAAVLSGVCTMQRQG